MAKAIPYGKVRIGDFLVFSAFFVPLCGNIFDMITDFSIPLGTPNGGANIYPSYLYLYNNEFQHRQYFAHLTCFYIALVV